VYHFVISTPNAARTEFVDIFAQGGSLLLKGERVPRNGVVELSDAPGLGYELEGGVISGRERAALIW